MVIIEHKQEVEYYLGQIDRDTEILKNYLDESDYYTAPASKSYHLNYEGGLVEHSLNVMELLLDKQNKFEVIDYESAAICGLFHDICKTNYYVKDEEKATQRQINYLENLAVKNGKNFSFDNPTKSYCSDLIDWLKDNPDEEMPEYKPAYKIEDNLPLGHGEKSLYILSSLIELRDCEAVAIRWHMGPYDEGWNCPAYNQAQKDYPLMTLLQTADQEATWILEV